MADIDLYYEGEGAMEYMANSPEVTYNWVEITSDFFNHIKDLKLGELLHDGQLFGLFEAMSAIEMMDPKMDAGMLCNRGQPKPMTFPEALKAGKLKIENLEPSEIIGIMDATLACIASWLEGHSLAQTVFTNLYLHQPHSIINRTLKSFCIAVYKLLESIKICIKKAQVSEEEDFQPMGYGFSLGSSPQTGNTYDATLEVSDVKCISMLREQEEELNKKARLANDEESLWPALTARIKFTRMFFQALQLITKRETPGGGDCVALLNGCSDMMKIISATSCKGTQPEEDSDKPNPMGFEPMVNQRLLPPTFPRYTRIKPRDDALRYFNDLIIRLRHAWKITSCNSFHTALDFFMDFSKHRSCILSRSALQLLYICPSPASIAMTQGATNGGSTAHKNAFIEILKESIRSFVNPPTPPTKNPMLYNPQGVVDLFLVRCVRPFSRLLQICGYNRARQRVKLALLIEEFAALQEEAEGVDKHLLHYPQSTCSYYSTWIQYHVMRLMISYLASGLELELYSVHEYYYIYWYMYEFIYGWWSSSLNRAEVLYNQSLPTKQKGARKQKKRAKPYAREALLCQVMMNMSGGFYKALLGFRNQGRIKHPESEFDNEAVRYKHRFAAFSVVTPPQIHYGDFRRMIQPFVVEDWSILYLGGCKHFQHARMLLESVTPDPEINDLLKVAKTNFIVLKLLAGGHKIDDTTTPIFDFSVHKHFPIIKLA